MWLFTTVGFFSIVQKPDDKFLSVRARVAEDLDRLREEYMPELSEIVEWPGADYRYRAFISHEDFARGLAKLAMDIDYPNFKAAVGRRQGPDRELLYSRVWGIMQELEKLGKDPPGIQAAFSWLDDYSPETQDADGPFQVPEQLG